MIFNSLEYLIFLPVVFLLYWYVFKSLKWQNLFVVVVSYFFYGMWDCKFLLLIAFTTLCSFVTGIVIGSDVEKGNVSKAKAVCVSNVVINLLILGIFKYYNFFADSFVSFMSYLGISVHATSLKLILPVGISFYTFQALSYSIDVYKGKLAATRDIISFFAFISFFPQLVAGPIERATNLLPQFAKARIFEYDKAVDGMRLILWGLFKKIVIADNCAEFVDKVFNNYEAHNGSTLALAGLFFAFQIYGDFSGYSDIAIGTAKLFGISLRDNFRMPYFSRDIAEFWKRWHISLNKWFVDYVYIPLGGSRCSKILVARNVFVIFLLSGLWHGANWTYVAWGAYHACLFLPLIMLNLNKRNTDVVAKDKKCPSAKEFFSMLLTFVLVIIGWIIFRADNITAAYDILAKVLNVASWENTWFSMTYKTPVIIAIFLCLIVEWINRTRAHSFEFSWIKNKYVHFAMYYFIVACIVLFSGQNVTFIYFQF
ncbi:MAG: MBOAT family protein [Bacteroidales bacterium]|nr:MBOAT family protein [Candidatus Scybalocola fimicaballi]